MKKLILISILAVLALSFAACEDTENGLSTETESESLNAELAEEQEQQTTAAESGTAREILDEITQPAEHPAETAEQTGAQTTEQTTAQAAAQEFDPTLPLNDWPEEKRAIAIEMRTMFWDARNKATSFLPAAPPLTAAERIASVNDKEGFSLAWEEIVATIGQIQRMADNAGIDLRDIPGDPTGRVDVAPNVGSYSSGTMQSDIDAALRAHREYKDAGLWSGQITNNVKQRKTT